MLIYTDIIRVWGEKLRSKCNPILVTKLKNLSDRLASHSATFLRYLDDLSV